MQAEEGVEADEEGLSEGSLESSDFDEEDFEDDEGKLPQCAKLVL